jgi:hypothetical protein
MPKIRKQIGTIFQRGSLLSGWRRGAGGHPLANEGSAGHTWMWLSVAWNICSLKVVPANKDIQLRVWGATQQVDPVELVSTNWFIGMGHYKHSRWLVGVRGLNSEHGFNRSMFLMYLCRIFFSRCVVLYVSTYIILWRKQARCSIPSIIRLI